MSYEKQTWEDGQVITADKLNHMEDGIANSESSDFVITFSGTSSDANAAADKTWSETAEAYNLGKRIRCQYSASNGDITELATLLKFSGGELNFVQAAITATTYSSNSLTVISMLCEYRSTSVEVIITMSSVAATPIS